VVVNQVVLGNGVCILVVIFDVCLTVEAHVVKDFPTCFRLTVELRSVCLASSNLDAVFCKALVES
jgi:hypothetical protein